MNSIAWKKLVMNKNNTLTTNEIPIHNHAQHIMSDTNPGGAEIREDCTAYSSECSVEEE
jgi:hypothetical protein